MNGNLKPFGRAKPNLPPLADFIESSAKFGVTPQVAMQNYDHCAAMEVWKNDEYQVAIDKTPDHGFGAEITIWHLSIKRLDRDPLHDWRDLQQIKNMLCGPDVEAFELYPAQARVVDTSNQYHLFAIMADGEDRAPPMPIGWQAGMILEPDNADGSYNDSLARQRPSAKGGSR